MKPAVPSATRLDALQFGLVSASVFGAILPHLPRLPLWFSALVLAVFAGRCLMRMRGGGRLPVWVKVPLVLIFPVFIFVHYGNIFGREPGSALACAMLVLKLVETDSRRDARAAICFASFVLMSALLFDSGLGFALLLFTTLALFLATLRELDVRAANVQAVRWQQRLRTALRGGAFALLSALPLALCGFIFFPRLGSPLWGAPNDTSAHTGLGDSMEPGAIQELLIDEAPAFRVSFDGPPPPRSELYWRGPVLWHFDGRAWTRPEYFSSMHSPVDVEPTTATIGYDVTLEPSARHWLLALDVPLDVPEGAVRGADMSLVNHAVVDHSLRYHATSATHYLFEPALLRQHRQLATDLPAEFNPRARELAQSWRREFVSDDKIIKAALAFFHNEFYYTLDAPLLARDSVDDFLFGEKKGFCEHYSSAFTFLMRAAGIPARVVTGYQGGYYVNSGAYLIVRQSDAHAWSEVWLEGRGWVRVDPTAAVSPQRVSLGARAAAGSSARWYQADWLLEVRNQLDLVNRVWNNAVVQFNALRQQQLLTPFGIDKAEYTQLMTVLIATSSLLLGLFAWWTLRAPRHSGDPLDTAYLQLCRKLARAGAARAPAEGPLAYAERLGASALRSSELETLLRDYASLRYACEFPPARAVRAFAHGVAALRIHAAAMGNA
jgi:transglutaminase-like putative cysteine protease